MWKLAALAVCLLVSSPLPAAVLYVRVTGDDTASGTSWAEALASVTEANRRAVSSGGASVINVGPGRYAERIRLEPSVTLVGSVDPATDVSNPDLTPSVLDAERLGPVVECDPLASTSTLEGFVITGGLNPDKGGGIACALASATFRNNRLVDNHSANDGGAMSVADAAPLIENNLFMNNSSDDDAGGLRMARCAGAVVRGNTFASNVAAADGGGLRLRDAAGVAVWVENNLFIGNRAAVNGGGLSVVNADFVSVGNIFRGNHAEAEGGGLSVRDCTDARVDMDVYLDNSSAGHGGAHAFRTSDGLVSRVLALRNSAAEDGGGLRVRLGGAFRVEGSVYARNSAGLGGVGQGGGIAIAGASATIFNSFLFRNAAVAGGGLVAASAIDVGTTPASIVASAVSLIRNEVTTGSGAAAHTSSLCSLDISDSIVWDNRGSIDLGGSGTTTVSTSDVEDPVSGTGVFSADPLLVSGPLESAWISAPSYLSELLAGQLATSPAVDTGGTLAVSLGLGSQTTRSDEVTDAGMLDLGYHAASSLEFWGFDLFRSESTRVLGELYIAGAASGVEDPEPVLLSDAPLHVYRLRGVPILHVTKSADSVRLWH